MDTVTQLFPHINPDVTLIIPQLIVLGTALLLLLGDLMLDRSRHRVLTMLTLVGLSAALIANFFYIGVNRTTFNGMFRADDVSVFINLIALIGSILSVMISASYLEKKVEPGSMPLPEYYVLLLFSTLGAMVVGSAGDLLMVFIGIEMGSLAIYALTGFARKRLTSLEGSLKYFLLGLFASAILLYGMAWVYGATGTTNLDGIATALSGTVTDGNLEPSLLLALLLLTVGLGFKIAAVPFHMWTPDAYQGAPTPVSAYMSVIPKVAGFAAMIRIFPQALAPMRDEWVTLLGILALITMALGNIVAVSQRDVKRMLAYSSIGHTGYALAGLAAFGAVQAVDDRSVSSVLYYLFAYAFMNVGAFAIVAWLQERGGGTNIDDFNGLASRSPLAALAMTVFMFSLMGIPPLVGFYAKYYVIVATIEADMIWLAIAIVLASAVSAFFYLRVVAAMYFSPAPDTEMQPSRVPLMATGLAVMTIGTLVAGIFSSQVFNLAQNWINAFSTTIAMR